MERALAGQPLWKIPFLRKASRPSGLYGSQRVRVSLNAWEAAATRSGLTTFPSPLTPINSNPNFTPGLDQAFRHWEQQGRRSIGHFFNEKGPISFEDFRVDFAVPETEWYHYQQIRHWVMQPQVRQGAERRLTPYER